MTSPYCCTRAKTIFATLLSFLTATLCLLLIQQEKEGLQLFYIVISPALKRRGGNRVVLFKKTFTSGKGRVGEEWRIRGAPGH